MNDRQGYIKIFVQPGAFPTQYDYQAVVAFDELWVAEAMLPIDAPSPDSDLINQLFCTDVNISQKIIKNRKGIARFLAATLTKKIMEAFEQQDKINGYDKKEWEAFHRGD